jgi:hypothetical protein
MDGAQVSQTAEQVATPEVESKSVDARSLTAEQIEQLGQEAGTRVEEPSETTTEEVPQESAEADTSDSVWEPDGKGGYRQVPFSDVMDNSVHYIKHNGKEIELSYPELKKLAQLGRDSDIRYQEARGIREQMKRMQDSIPHMIEEKAIEKAREMLRQELEAQEASGGEQNSPKLSMKEKRLQEEIEGLKKWRNEFETRQKTAQDEAQQRAVQERTFRQIVETENGVVKSYEKRFITTDGKPNKPMLDLFQKAVRQDVRDRLQDIHERRGNVTLEDVSEVWNEEAKRHATTLLGQVAKPKPPTLAPIKGGGAPAVQGGAPKLKSYSANSIRKMSLSDIEAAGR